jgi:truncated hemoglobin YjbI
MTEPQSQLSSKEEIDASLNNSLNELLAYLDEYLKNFPSFFKIKTLIKPIEAEKKISRELYMFLNNVWDKEKISIFHFYPEWDYDNSHRSSDLAVIDVRTDKSQPTETFFTIEAKRLPTGSGEREKEYVEGNLGGIERYKRGHHGKGLPESAMVGYVQKETCSHWHNKINEWINDLIQTNTDIDIIWNNADLLIHSDNFDKVQKYVSDNKREKDSIKLHHYLMELV